MKKATRQQTKDHNTRLILKTLYEADAISRADIARATGLTRPTVSSIVGELIDADLVLELGPGPSAGGKPPILLQVNFAAWHILAVDLGSRDYRAARVNLRGDIVECIEVAAGSPTHGEETLAHTFRLIDDLMARGSTPIIGIGLGAPGVIDPMAGIVRRAVNLGWQELPIRDLLQDRYGLATYVINDSHAAALAEYMFGQPRESNNLIVIKVSQGIGAGIILNGRPLYGDGFGAGEIGHLVVSEAGELCTCGNRGCLETIASTRALVRRVQTLTQEPLRWEELVARYQAGEHEVGQLVTEAGRALGVALASLIAAFNVETLVVSGRVAQFGQPLLDAAYQEAHARALPAMVEETTLRFSPLGTEMVLLGCSASVLQHELGVV